ncbi:hypothetical protein C0995_010607 [Termitomyces sp. Mi166|nr:hypothetical protein C0995_010607 [Termitomyces sp. Mi166\
MSRGRGFTGRAGGRGGGRGGFQHRDAGPPDQVLEDEMFCASSLPDKVPYFNAPIYLQNKSVIGKVDEILGPINEVYFSVKMGEGMVASSFKKGDKVYIGGDKLLPIERFLPKPKAVGERGRGGRGAAGGRGGRGTGGGRGFQRGGARGGRGGARGGFGDRGRGAPRGGGFGGGRGGGGRGGGRGFRGS